MSSKLVHHLRDVNTLKTASRNHLPLPTGQLKKVGCRDLLVGYTRKGGLLVRLFYPAAQDDEHPNTATHNPLLWSSWLPHENYRQGYVDMTGIRANLIRQMILKMNFNKNFYIPAIQNVQPMSRDQKYPVVVFSHGLGGCRTSYSTACLELASHGFVVAAVEHRDNSACLSYFARNSAKSDHQDEVEFGSEILNPPYAPPNSLPPLTNSANLDLAWIRYRFASLTKHTPQVQQFRNNQVRYRAQECSRALNLWQPRLHTGEIRIQGGERLRRLLAQREVTGHAGPNGYLETELSSSDRTMPTVATGSPLNSWSRWLRVRSFCSNFLLRV